VTGNQVEAVKKFFQNQSALEAFMKFLKEEHAEENGEFFKVFMAQIVFLFLCTFYFEINVVIIGN
jgi:hypothetical protein